VPASHAGQEPWALQRDKALQRLCTGPVCALFLQLPSTASSGLSGTWMKSGER